MYQVSKAETGKRIRKLMLQSGITVRELQEEMNLESPQSIYKWVNGKALPSIENLLILGKMLNMPIESIVVLEEKDREKIEDWEKKHPPVVMSSYFGIPDQVQKADAERITVIVENLAKERLRAVLSND